MARFPLALLCLVNVALAANEWVPAGPDDSRSPCPMLNSLANHGYLPHDGKNIDVPTLVAGLDEALNLDATAQSFFTTQGERGLTTSSTGNASTFHLNDLKMHNVIEHDVSLSRADEAQGDSVSFNQTIFDETKSYWPDDVITTAQAAAALQARLQTQRANNPQFDLPAAQLTNAIGQTAMYLGVFGEYGPGDANRDWVQFLFENEELPTKLGWARKTDANQITYEGIVSMITNVAAAMNVTSLAR